MIFLFVFCFFFKNKVSQCRPSYSVTYSVGQAGLERRDSPALPVVFALNLRSVLWPWRSFTLPERYCDGSFRWGHLMVLISLESGYLVAFILLDMKTLVSWFTETGRNMIILGLLIP